MAIWLRQLTIASDSIGPFISNADFKTASSSLTIAQADVRLSKNGAAYAQKNGSETVPHQENGYYVVTLNGTDTNTLGTLRLAVAISTNLPVWKDYQVVSPGVYDALVTASNSLPVDVREWASASAVAGAIPAVAAGASGGLPLLNAHLTVLAQDQGAGMGSAVTGTLSTTQATTDLTGFGDDHFTNGWMIWFPNTSGLGAAVVTDYDSASGLFTWSPAIGGAPSNGDPFSLFPALIADLGPAATASAADGLLNRNLAMGGSGHTRRVQNALRVLRNRVNIATDTNTAIVYTEDDSTTAWTMAVATDSLTSRISGVDPT